MDADRYNQILEWTLLSFLHEVMSNSHRFMQSNDPNLSSRKAQDLMVEHSINWWKTLPESPDCNPIDHPKRGQATHKSGTD